MKNNNLIKSIIALASLLLFTYCHHTTEKEEDINEPVIGSGRIASEFRSLSECKGVRIQNIGNIFITQENSQTVRIESDDNIIKDVVTKVENGILTLSLTKKNYSNITLHVYVSIPAIERLLIEGAGNIVVEKPIICNDLTCSINGAGNITLKGSSNTMTCTINGAGNLNAFELYTTKCLAIVNGTGNCEVNVSKELTATITGTGKITYDGNPATINSSISGLGKVIKR